MLTISKPISAAQACRYHADEFRNARANYYTASDEIRGTYHGRLAARWGLSGDVHDEPFRRLAEGQHPITGEPLVHHQTPRQVVTARGETRHPMTHRAGWDLTFSAPKTVSLTALVGEDARVRDAHRASVRVAVDETERYVQARLGGNRPAETTGNWVAAVFEHDSARPVDGYAAPQLHTHVVAFNLTQTETGAVRPVQPRELYRTQPYATAVYRSELAARLTALGYEIERGPSGQPDIGGYSPAYVEASSPRRRQIETHLATVDHRGAEAAEIAAHRTRSAKLARDDDSAIKPADMHRRHRELAEVFGHQPARVVRAAQDREHQLEPSPSRITAHAAVTFSKDRNIEREAVVDERGLLRDALARGMGDLTLHDIRNEFEAGIAAGEFVATTQPPGSAGRAFTTREMIALEQGTIERMRHGQGGHSSLVALGAASAIEHGPPVLSAGQRAAVQQILASRDQMLALEGVAGAGKTTTLAAVRDAASSEGYIVEGFAPTSRAAQQLAHAGIASTTLQAHLARREPDIGPMHLYVLDESSLASTRQMHAFLHRLGPEDRVLLVGDTRQHQAVEAGRPYQQLQDAGVSIVRLDDIVRQQDPALKAVVAHLARGQVHDAIQQLDAQGRVHEIADREARLRAIAHEYATQPDRTLVVSPDHYSRRELNRLIHEVMQSSGVVDRQEHSVRVLVARQHLTGADRQWASQYALGDVVRYTSGSRTYALAAGAYARVEQVHPRENHLTVRQPGGEALIYDPRRLQGVAVYREVEQIFARGDRVQVTAPDRQRHVANRELGTIVNIEGERLDLRFDAGRTLGFSTAGPVHLDYGYAVTSHSSQGQTADRVLVHVDTDQGEVLVNRRLAYVAVSRGRYDAQVYTNDKARLEGSLNRERCTNPPLRRTEHLLTRSSVQRLLVRRFGSPVTKWC